MLHYCAVCGASCGGMYCAYCSRVLIRVSLSFFLSFFQVPELIEDFADHIASLLSERNHAVLLTGTTLMIQVIELEPSWADSYRRLVPSVIRILKNLVMNNYAPEHDVGGITDPFLQVKERRERREYTC